MVDEFEEVSDLPELNDPDPDIDDPNYEPLNTPVLLSNLLKEIVAFSDDDSPISEFSKSKLRDLNSKLKEKGLKSGTLSEIDMDFLTYLMNPDNSIDPELDVLLTELFELPDLKASLPEILQYGELTTPEAISDYISSSKIGTGKEGLRQLDSDLYAICAEKANRAFQHRLEALTEQLVEQEDQINDNYLRRAYDAEERLIERNVLVHELLKEQLVEYQVIINKILNAARKAVLAGDLDLQEDLLAYGLIYATNIRLQMAGWFLSSISYNHVFYELEINSITILREDRIAAVKQYYLEGVEMAEEILARAIRVYCHNQGSGS
ncbi:hypothetical protein GCM10027284_02300 [Cyclobacterium sediminis]